MESGRSQDEKINYERMIVFLIYFCFWLLMSEYWVGIHISMDCAGVLVWEYQLPYCTMCSLGSMFSFQPNKLRHTLKFISWYIIQHILVPTCSVGRKTWFSRKLWFSNSKFGISKSFWPILSVPKIMLPVPENEKRNKFSSFLPKT